MIIITAGILHYRSDPDGAEAERFDVVELLNQPFEIPSPGRIRIRISCFGVIPGMNVVAGIAIVEAGSDHKVNGILPEVPFIADTVHKALGGPVAGCVDNKEL
ncbi:hypothetical protein D3C75_647780 [compost metagenome]